MTYKMHCPHVGRDQLDALTQAIDIAALFSAKQLISYQLFLTPPPPFIFEVFSKNGPPKTPFLLSIRVGISPRAGFFIKRVLKDGEILFSGLGGLGERVFLKLGGVELWQI